MMYFMRLRSLLALIIILLSNEVVAQNNKIVFSVNAPGTKPYLYFDEKSNSYQGIIVDLFASIEGEHRFDVTYLDTSRNRYEKTLLNKQADLFVSAEDWLYSPGEFLFSDTLAQHDSHLYSVTPFKHEFDIKKIEHATICTRTNFIYPMLSEHFKTGQLIRLDSTNQSTMTSMLLKERCSYLISGKEDAHAEMFSAKYCNNVFFQSPAVISSVNMILVIRQDRPELLKIINPYLKNFIVSGQRDKSFIKHVGALKFPKQRC